MNDPRNLLFLSPVAGAKPRRRAAAVLLCALLAGWTSLAMAQTPEPAGSPPPAAVQDTAPQPAPGAGAPSTAVPTQAPGGTPARQIGEAPVAHDMSPLSMFLGADIVVKSVLVLLAFASLATWTILIAKSFELMLAKRRIKMAIETLRRSDTLTDAEARYRAGRTDVVSRLVAEAADEARISAGVGAGGGVWDRASARCAETIRTEARRLRVGTGLLATIGSTAPFVGLFGTVWGIMNSFVGIAKSQTTNLAVVAPGIAEALFATAVGLIAAIPAVIVYNHFARVTKNHLERVSRASGIVLRLLSRDLDHDRPIGYKAAE